MKFLTIYTILAISIAPDCFAQEKTPPQNTDSSMHATFELAQAGQAVKGAVYVGKVVRDGVIYDVFKRGSKKIYKKVGRVRNSNRSTYKAPTKKKCGYFSTTNWRGKITYKKICK